VGHTKEAWPSECVFIQKPFRIYAATWQANG